MTPMTGVLQREEEEEEEIHIEEGVVEELLHYPVIAVITVITTVKYLSKLRVGLGQLIAKNYLDFA